MYIVYAGKQFCDDKYKLPFINYFDLLFNTVFDFYIFFFS